MKDAVYRSIVSLIEHEPWGFDACLDKLKRAHDAERFETLRSILAQEYQKRVKRSFGAATSDRKRGEALEAFEARVRRGDPPGIVVDIADGNEFSPALTAKLVLEAALLAAARKSAATATASAAGAAGADSAAGEGEAPAAAAAAAAATKNQVTKYLRDTTLIADRDLAYEVFLAGIQDDMYGRFAEAIKQSIGEEHEQKLKAHLRARGLAFADEADLRRKGYDKTPDVKLEVPFARRDGRIVNWIESKALFGDRDSHQTYLRDQLWSYWNRFGPGLVIYWFGFVDELNDGPDCGIVLADEFPADEDIVRFDPLRGHERLLGALKEPA